MYPYCDLHRRFMEYLYNPAIMFTASWTCAHFFRVLSYVSLGLSLKRLCRKPQPVVYEKNSPSYATMATP